MESISGENGWCSPSPLSNWPLPNVWLGVSVEDQAAADDRIPELLDTPAAVRFLSCEPLLGQLMLRRPFVRDHKNRNVMTEDDDQRPIVPGSFPGLHWVIVGGESGPGARPCAIGWIRDIVGQCRAAGVPVFVKQLGARPVRTVRGSWINELQRHGPDIQQPYGRAACWACRTEECKLLWPGVPPHVKRWLPLRDRKGGDMSEWPEDLRVREFPS